MSRGSSRATQLRDERLSAYIDDDLTAEERAALEAEFAADETFRDDLDGMRAVTAALGQLEPVRAPRPFTLEAAPASSRRPRFVDFGLQLGAALSALLLVVAIVDPGDGGGITSSAVPIEQSRTAETSAQLDDTDGGAALAGGGAPEQAPSAPNDGDFGATGEENGDAGSTGEATTTDEPSTPPTESLQAQPPSPADGGDAPAPDDTSRAQGDDGATTAPPPADTGPAAPAEAGDADPGSAARPQPVPGTEEPLGASDLGGGETDFVPALAVLTALLTALVALRWAQTRRIA